MMYRSFWVLGVLWMCGVSYGYFSPNVTVTSCNSRRVVVKLENAADGGIIFIQGSNGTCRDVTIADTKHYEFDFDLCDIEYDTKFRIVVQKNPLYQTGFDKLIPVMCMVDTSDLFVSGVVFPQESIDKLRGVNKTVRPTVSMRISAGNGLTTAAEVAAVNLNDKVQLTLTLDDPYLEDFDIKAKDCRAEMISLIKEECSDDLELFPNFEKQNQGQLQAAFQAFRPTNIDEDEEEVDIAFTCSVAVCKGQCNQRVCGEIVGWGRKKRSDVNDDDVIEKVTCATKLKVKASKKEGLFDGLSGKLQGDVCAEKVAVVSVMAVIIFTLIVSWIVCACVTMKLRSVTRSDDHPKKASALRRMSEKNVNFARSVGRRLSTMLNLPIGYNMRDRKMSADIIPEAEITPPTKRRDSVTVRTYSETDKPFYINEALDTDTTNTNKSESQCTLRKRCVDFGVQADIGSNGLVAVRPNHSKCSPLSKNPFSFITSISIKSGVSKQKMGNRSESFREQDRSNGHSFLDKPISGKFQTAKSFDYGGQVNGPSLKRSPNVDMSNENIFSANDHNATFDDDIYDVIDARSKASENDSDSDTRSTNSNPMGDYVAIDPEVTKPEDEPISFVGNVKLVRKYSTQV